MTTEQILEYGVEYNGCLKELLERVSKDYLPQVKLMFLASTDENVRLAMQSMMMAFKRELKDMENELNRKYVDHAI